MKQGMRLINGINIIASFIPLIMLVGINTGIIARLLFDESGSDVVMGLIFAYILIVGPVFLVITGIYGLLWLFMFIMSVFELVYTEYKMWQTEKVYAIILNVASYVMSIWLLLFWILSCFLLFIGLLFVESLIFIFSLNYISMVAAGISIAVSVLYTAGLIADKFKRKEPANAGTH